MGSSACEHRARHTVNEIFYYTISWQSACRFTTHVTCRLTAKNWDQLRNQTLGNPVWTLLFLSQQMLTAIKHVADDIWLPGTSMHLGQSSRKTHISTSTVSHLLILSINACLLAKPQVASSLSFSAFTSSTTEQ